MPTTVLPYHLLDLRRAVRELTILPVQEAGGPIHRWITDSYCVRPGCPCTDVILHVNELIGEVPEGEPRSDEEESAIVRRIMALKDDGFCFVWDFATGKLAYRGDDETLDAPAPPEAEPTRDALARALEGDVGARFRERKALATEWGKENYWTLLDWDDTDPDELIAWEHAFPHEPPYEVERNGVRYVLRDFYCIRPDCHCKELEVAVEESPTGNRRGKSVGSLSVSARNGLAEFDEFLGGKGFLARRVLEDLLRTHPEARTVLPLRIERMHEIGGFRQGFLDAEESFEDDLEEGIDDDAWDEDSEDDEPEDEEALPDERPGVASELRRLALLGDPAEADAARILEDLERAPRVRPPEADGMGGSDGDDDEVAPPESLPGPAAGAARGSMPGRKSGSAPGPKVGRNDPCPCGSGKKFKKCCGR